MLLNPKTHIFISKNYLRVKLIIHPLVWTSKTSIILIATYLTLLLEIRILFFVISLITFTFSTIDTVSALRNMMNDKQTSTFTLCTVFLL